MSTPNALATVTAALASTLSEVAHAIWPGSRVFIGRPERRAGQQRDQPAINIFLYQTTVNPNWRNADAPTRDRNGRLVQRPAIGLDLNYMLTFYGPGFVPQLLLGHTVSRLHARPLLSQVNISNALSQTDSIPGDSVLRQTDLDQYETIRLSPMHFTLDELSRLWSVFFQTPYDLSIAYQASVILMEAMDEIPQPALPVRGAAGYQPAPGAIPQIEQVTPQFVFPGTGSITLKGKNLAAPGVQVRFGSLPALVAPEFAGPDLSVKLPADLSAGIIPVSVVTGSNVTSNAAALVFRPAISKVDFAPSPRQITLDLQPPIQAGQRGLLLLNQRLPDINSTERRAAYALPLVPPAAPASVVAVDAAAVMPGVYLVRVQIDGAESRLDPPPAGTDDQAFAGPTVTVP
jgi:hypothetical protein